MSKKKRSWLSKLIWPQPAHRARPRVRGFRNCTVEQLEQRAMLAGHTFPTLAQMLVARTPDPHPSGDLPADMSRLVPLSSYTPMELPPDLTTIPEVHDFVVGLTEIYTDIANNPDARPAFWVDNAPGTNGARVYLDDNGMLTTQWTIDWGDGTTPDVVAPSPWVFHQYATAGDYTVSVTAVGMDGTYTADGVDPPISPSAPAVRVAGQQMVTAGQTFSLANLAAFSLSAAADISSFNYSIDWGDGTAAETNPDVTEIAAGSAASPFMASISSEHVYNAPGTYYVAITVADKDPNSDLSDTQTIPVNVVAVPVTPTGFATTLVTDSQIGLTWSADTTDLSGFQIEQSADGGSTWSPPVSAAANQSDTAILGAFDPSANYQFQIQSVNLAGAISSPAVLDVLGSPTVTPASDTEVDLSWQTLPQNVSSPTLQRSDDYGTTWAPVDTSSATTTNGLVSFADTSLTGGATYEYQIVGQLPDGTSVATPIVTATTLPSAPSNVSAVYVSGDEIEVSWQNNSPTASGFQINGALAGDTLVPLATADSGETSFVVSGLSPSLNPGDTWQFTVQALDDNGNLGPSSATANVDIPTGGPSQPVIHTIAANSPYQVTITWYSATSATGYTIERQDPGDTAWQNIASTTSLSYVDSTLQPETTYSYRIVATNGSSPPTPSTPSDPANVETSLLPPTDVQATVLSGDKIELDWTVDTVAGDGFTIVWSTSNGDPSGWTNQVSTSTPISADTTSIVVTPSMMGLTGAFTNSQTYYFAVEKTDGSLTAYSDTAPALIPALPSVPTFDTPTINSPSEIDVSWLDNGQSSFILQRSADNGSTWSTISTLTAGTTSYSDTSVTSGDSYLYRIYGTNTPAVTETVRSEIDLSWSDPNGGTVPYTLERSADGGITWTTVASLAGGTTIYHDTGVTAGTSYEYQIVGTNTAGTSAAASVSATDSTGSVMPPTDLQVSWDRSTNDMLVSWTNQSFDVASTEIDWTLPNETTQWTHHAYAGAGIEQWQLLSNSQPGTWQFRVESVASNGDKSSVLTVTYDLPYLRPVAHDDTYWAMTNRATTFPVVDNDVTDSQSSNVSLSLSTVESALPAHGIVTVSGDGKSLIYTSDPGFAGSDSFQYTVTTGYSDSWPATITVNVTDAVPVATGGGISGESYSGGVWTITGYVHGSYLFNTGFPDSEPGLTFSKVSNPAGALSCVVNSTDGSFIMTLAGSEFDTPIVPTFTYQCSDGLLTSNVAIGTSYQTYQVVSVLPGAQYAGQLSNWNSSSTIGSQFNGDFHITNNSDGSFTYLAPGDFNGQDWLAYATTDNLGNVSYYTTFFDVANDPIYVDSANTGSNSSSPVFWTDGGYGNDPSYQGYWGISQTLYAGYSLSGTGDIVPNYQAFSDRNLTDLTSPGQVVPLNTAVNADGVPGYADGYGLYGNSAATDQLVPVFINLPAGFNASTGSMKIQYSGSDPQDVIRTGLGTNEDPYQYALPQDGGALRIWTSNDNRTWKGISAYVPGGTDLGYYVPSGELSATDVAHLSAQTWDDGYGYPWAKVLEVYVERVRPSANTDENSITISFDLDGSGNWSRPETILVADPPMLDSDALNASSGALNAGTGALSVGGLPDLGADGNPSTSVEQYSQQLTADTSNPGKIVVVNDALSNGVPAFANFSGSGNSQFVPMVVKLPQGTDLSEAMLQFDYNGSDPSAIKVDGSGSDTSYLPAPGTLRLWTMDASTERNVAGVADESPGDYITANTPFPATVLGETWTDIPGSTDMEAVVYVEAVRASTSTGDQWVSLTVDVDGTGNFIDGGSARFTVVQDTVPDYSASGLASVAQGADGGNPMSNAFSGSVRLSDGIVNYATTDFSVPGPSFAITVSRVWTDQPGLVVNPSFGNGEIMTQLPYLIQATGTIIAVIDGQPFYFDQVSSTVYQERFFGLEKLTYDAGDHQYEFDDTTGTRILFNDFTIQDYSDPTKGMYERGAMKSVEDANGNTITVTGYDRLGNTTLVSYGGDLLRYEYTSVDKNAERLTSVTLTRDDQDIAKASYTYYVKNDTSENGNNGDLKQAVVSTLGTEVGGSYYRYSFAANSVIGGFLSDAVTGQAYTRLVASTFGANATSAASEQGSLSPLDDADVDGYADQFDYDGSNRVVSQIIVGAGASSAGEPWATGDFEYSYSDDLGPRGSGINAWHQITTITLPHDPDIEDEDANTQTVYMNFAGEPLLSTFTDNTDETNLALEGLSWNTFFAYDQQGRTVLTAQPSTLSQPDLSKPDLLDKQSNGIYRLMSSSDGLMSGTDYYTTTNTSTGAVAGYVEDTYVQHGQQTSSKALQDFYKYATLSGSGITIHPVSDDAVYSAATSSTSNSSARNTHFDYQSSGLHVAVITETLPSVSGQNVVGVSDTIITIFDSYGRPVWVRDGVGVISYTAYSSTTGTVTEDIQDADVSNSAQYSSTDWDLLTAQSLNTTSGVYQNIITNATPDPLGRPVQTLDGNRKETTIEYADGLLQSSVTTIPPAGPTQTVLTDMGQGTITTNATSPDGLPQTVSEVWLDFAGRTLMTQRYDGKGGQYTTLDRYDDSGRLFWTQNAAGTITETEFDGLGRPTVVLVGTFDWNLIATEWMEYDNNGVGDGNLTWANQFSLANSPNHVTASYYDWRDRLVTQNNSVEITFNTLDNLDEAYQTDVYANDSASVSNLDGTVSVFTLNGLRAETKTDYDNQGRVYATHVFSVDPTNGTVGSSLRTDYYHDGRGDVVATVAPGGLVTNTSFDGADRATIQESGNANTATGATPGSIGTVIQYVSTQYDADSDPIFVTTKQLNTDGSTYRITYVGDWYNAVNQLTDTVNYGTSPGVTITVRPDGPSAANGAVWTTNTYDAGGFLSQTGIVGGMATTYQNDDLGRAWRVVVNSTATFPSPQQSITNTTFDGLDRPTMVTTQNVTPQIGTTPPAQQNASTTRYYYATSAYAGSAINSDDFLSMIRYPDNTTQIDTYDALGQMTSQTNRDQSEHLFRYNAVGQQTFDLVSEFASGVDDHVRALENKYDALGRLTLATSYTVGAGVVNQVKRVYDGLGNLITEYQSHSGAVNTSSTPAVQYQYTTTYETAGTLWANGSSELTGVTYPAYGTTPGYQLTYTYSGLYGLDASIGRITSVSDSGGTLASFQYLGLSTVASETLPQPNITETTALDYLSNVSNVTWTRNAIPASGDVPASPAATLVNLDYGYTSVGEMLWRKDNAALSAGASLDQLYAYDQMYRATGFSQGTLNLANPAQPTISSVTDGNAWRLDSQGNRYDISGTTYGTSYNAADETKGTPGKYTSAGNTSTVTYDDGRGVTVTYDAWGRVVSTVSTPSGVGGPNGAAASTAYAYDALNRQISTTNVQASGGDNTGTQIYFDGSNPIQVRLLDNSTQLMQYVWSPADGRMIVRDAVVSVFNSYTGLSVTGNTASNTIQRLYPLADAQGSTVAVAAPAPTDTSNPLTIVQERYTYTVDGQPQARNPDFTNYKVNQHGNMVVTSGSTLGWNWLFQGQQWIQTQPDWQQDMYEGDVDQWHGFNVSASGVWSDAEHARTLQPNLSAYGDAQQNPYETTGWEKAATIYTAIAPAAIGLLVTVATGGLGAGAVPLLLGGAVGGGLAGFSNSYIANQSGWRIAGGTAVGAVAGGVSGLVGYGVIGSAAAGFGRVVAGGALAGAVGGGIQGTYQGYMEEGTFGGALYGGANGALIGSAYGAASGALLYGGIRLLASSAFVGETRSIFVPGRGQVEVSSDLVAQLGLDKDIQRALLRDAISSIAGEGLPGTVTHHLVPLESVGEFPELMTKAAEGGFDINGAENGIRLWDWNQLDRLGLLDEEMAEAVQHFQNHPIYSQVVLEQLAQIPGNVSAAQAASLLRSISGTLRGSIINNQFTPYG